MVFEIIKCILLTATGLYLVYELTKEPTEDFIFDFIWILGKLIIGIIILLWTFNNNRKEYKHTKSTLSFLPVISAIILSIIFTFIQTRENPAVLLARDDGDSIKIFLELRADGTYQLGNGSVLGNTYSYGKYQLNDSIIILDKSEIDKVIESNKLVIRPYLESLNPTNDTIIYQLDKNGQILKDASSFWLREDNRKNFKRSP